VTNTSADAALQEHLAHFFRPDHTIQRGDFDLGPIKQRVPGYAYYLISPGRRTAHHTYVSTGVWDAVHDRNGRGFEFALMVDQPAMRHVELLTTLAFFHAGPPEKRLAHGHMVPIGEPWVPGSALDHVVLTRDSPLRSEFALCELPEGDIRILQIIPISAAEAQVRRDGGMEALEPLLQGIDYANPLRASVV
jgi:Suppressor of fused protein (SUFU)